MHSNPNQNKFSSNYKSFSEIMFNKCRLIDIAIIFSDQFQRYQNCYGAVEKIACTENKNKPAVFRTFYSE